MGRWSDPALSSGTINHRNLSETSDQRVLRVARSITARKHRRLLAPIFYSHEVRKSRQWIPIWRFRTIQSATTTLTGTATSVQACRIATPGTSRTVGAMDTHPSFGAAWRRLRAVPLLGRPRAPEPLAATARKNHKRRAGPPGQRDIYSRKKAGDRSRPPCPHAAKGVSSAPDTLSCWSGSGPTGAERSNATRAAAFTLPTPPRDV